MISRRREELLDPEVETVTPRGSLRGIAACRQVLQKASGDEQFAMEQAEPEFEDVEGDVVEDLDDERIVRIVVMPGGAALAGQ